MAISSEKPYRILKEIKDPKFEIDRLEFYNLFILMGIRDMQLFIIDNQEQRPVLLEDFMVAETESLTEKIDLLRKLFNDHHCLQAGFWNQVNVSFKNRKFTQVPADLFSDEMSNYFLSLNADFDVSNDLILNTEIDPAGLVNVFAVPNVLIDFFNQSYPRHTVKYAHQSSALIKGAVQGKAESHQAVIVYIDRFAMHVSASSGSRLLFYNQYPIKKFEDYLRFIKIAASELNIDLKSDKILIYGYLGDKTPHFESLKKVINNLEFGERPNHLKFGWVFDEIADHQYLDVFYQNQAN